MEVYRSLRRRLSKDKKKKRNFKSDKATKEQIRLKRFIEAEKRRKEGEQNRESKNANKKDAAKKTKKKRISKDAEITERLLDSEVMIQKAKDRERKLRKRAKEMKNIAELLKTEEAKARKQRRGELKNRHSGAKTLEELLNEDHRDLDNDYPQLVSLEPSISKSHTATPSTSKSEKTRKKRSKKDVQIAKAILLARYSTQRAKLWKKKYHLLKKKVEAVA